jgi:hypothetical protein
VLHSTGAFLQEATISGHIVANSGSFGGITLEDGVLTVPGGAVTIGADSLTNTLSKIDKWESEWIIDLNTRRDTSRNFTDLDMIVTKN